MAKIVFKELTSNQNVLFPVSLSDRIPSSHPVRIVDQVVNALNIYNLLSRYKGGGASSYHPRRWLKVLFYSYLNNIYSCYKIEKALQENTSTSCGFRGITFLISVRLITSEVSLDVQYSVY